MILLINWNRDNFRQNQRKPKLNAVESNCSKARLSRGLLFNNHPPHCLHNLYILMPNRQRQHRSLPHTVLKTFNTQRQHHHHWRSFRAVALPSVQCTEVKLFLPIKLWLMPHFPPSLTHVHTIYICTFPPFALIRFRRWQSRYKL